MAGEHATLACAQGPFIDNGLDKGAPSRIQMSIAILDAGSSVAMVFEKSLYIMQGGYYCNWNKLSEMYYDVHTGEILSNIFNKYE